MSPDPHAAGCARGMWLLEQLAARTFREVLRDALLSLGPACTCSAAATVQE